MEVGTSDTDLISRPITALLQNSNRNSSDPMPLKQLPTEIVSFLIAVCVPDLTVWLRHWDIPCSYLRFIDTNNRCIFFLYILLLLVVKDKYGRLCFIDTRFELKGITKVWAVKLGKLIQGEIDDFIVRI